MAWWSRKAPTTNSWHSVVIMPSCTASNSPRPPPRPPLLEAPTMSHQLIVLPDDTAKPLLDAIHGAKTALNIRMFLFTDESLLGAVTAAQKRGVKVRVMLNPARRTGESENEASRAALIAAGVDVRDSNPKFDLTHQKSMVVDNKTG